MTEENKTKRQLQAEQTKLKLFNAAVELLAQRDFESITIRDIVERADVSIGTFYNYYSTKLEVFYETYQVADHYFNQVVEPQLAQPTCAERVLHFFQHYAHYSGDLTDRKMTRLLYSPDNPWFNRPQENSLVAVLARVLQGGLDSGELDGRGDSAQEIANWLMICVRGLTYNWCTTGFAYDLAQATDGFVRRLLRSYLTTGTGE